MKPALGSARNVYLCLQRVLQDYHTRQHRGVNVFTIIYNCIKLGSSTNHLKLKQMIID